jgi:hypothetical protein
VQVCQVLALRQLGLISVRPRPVAGGWRPIRLTGVGSQDAESVESSGDSAPVLQTPACSLFGLKPTRARVPLGPLSGDLANGMAVEHALTRTMWVALLLDLTEGLAVGDPSRHLHWPAPWSRRSASILPGCGSRSGPDGPTASGRTRSAWLPPNAAA